MFERFTDLARRTMVVAQEEARLHHHDYIGTEHLLLGLVRVREGVAAKALESLGVSLEAVRERVQETIGPHENSSTGSPAFTAGAKRILERSLREALQLGHNNVGTEHILLGVIHEGESAAARALAGLTDLSEVRSAVLEVIEVDGNDVALVPLSAAPGAEPLQHPSATPASDTYRLPRTEKVRQRARFSDVVGQPDAVAELVEIKCKLTPGPETSATVPAAVLIYGPSGCGKTLLAKALAGESRAAFFRRQSSDLLRIPSKLAATRVKAVFREARLMAPAVLLIDELDLIGPGAEGTSRADLDDVVDQLVAEIESGSPLQKVVVVGETTRPDLLDPRLLRPGRFDRTIGIELLNEPARLEILLRHANNEQLDEKVNLSVIAERSPGSTGDELDHLINESALLAERAGRHAMTQADLERALDSLMSLVRRRQVGGRLSYG